MKNIKKPDRRIKRTKNLIKQSLTDLLKERELQDISITELCDIVDINRKTFYNHFPNIRAVLDEIENENIEKYLAYFKKEDVLSDLTNFYPFISRLTTELDQNNSLSVILNKSDEHLYIKEKIKKQLLVCFNEVFTKNPNIDHETIFFYLDFITAGIASVYQEWLLSDKKMSKDKLSKLISEVINNGGKTFIQALS